MHSTPTDIPIPTRVLFQVKNAIHWAWVSYWQDLQYYILEHPEVETACWKWDDSVHELSSDLPRFGNDPWQWLLREPKVIN